MRIAGRLGIVLTGATGMSAAASAEQISATVCAAHQEATALRRGSSGPLRLLKRSLSSAAVASTPALRRRRAAISRPEAEMTTQPSLAR